MVRASDYSAAIFISQIQDDFKAPHGVLIVMEVSQFQLFA